MSSHALAALGVLCLFLRTLAVEHANVDVQCGDEDETCDGGLVMLQVGKQQQQVNMTLTAEAKETSKAHANESKGEHRWPPPHPPPHPWPAPHAPEEPGVPSTSSTWMGWGAPAPPPPPAPSSGNCCTRPCPFCPKTCGPCGLGGTYTIQQNINKRFLDAYDSIKDYRLITQPEVPQVPGWYDQQKWIITSVGEDTYTIQHKTDNRFVDSLWVGDNPCVTRDASNMDGQHWIIKRASAGEMLFTIQQKGNHRFMDAYLGPEYDYGVVTMPQNSGESQTWILKPVSA